MPKKQILKFASRVELLAENGRKICDVHREEAERLNRNGQAVYKERGTFIRRLIVPDHNPDRTDCPISTDSRRSVYREVLQGGSRLIIETASGSPREVLTKPCVGFKMKSIRDSLRSFYYKPFEKP